MKDYTLLNLITIQDVFGAGSVRAYKIVKNLIENNLLNEELSSIFDEFEFSQGIKAKLLTAQYEKAESIIKLCAEHNVKIIGINDTEYPNVLKNINDPPIILYCKGNLPNFDMLPSITIVGPRHPSEYGKKAAFSLGYRLSRAGMIVVSGGAIGSDAAAHKGVFAADGKTVVVLGCGIDADYLPENKPLRDETLKNGCLISEYPPLTNATRLSFPIRNRIMSGLTLGTIVIEAPKKSGALITAKCAAEQGRDVFVIPGNPSQEEYKGSNDLLRDGAKPLIDASDIFNEYLPSFAEYLDIQKAFSKSEIKANDKKLIKKAKNIKEILSNEAKMVYNYLDKQIFTIDDLSGIDLSSDLILSALTELELENLIKSIPGGKYKII